MDEGYRRQSARRAAGASAQPLSSAPLAESAVVPNRSTRVMPVGSTTADYPLGTKTIVKRGGTYTPLLVDLSRLEMSSLQRYVAQFDLDAPPNATKHELVELASRHFAGHPHLREPEVVAGFLFANDSARRALQEPVDEP